MSLVLALIIVTDCLLLAVLVWLALRYGRPAIRGKCCPLQDDRKEVVDGADVQGLLTQAGKVLAEHSHQLEMFEQSLGTQAAAESADRAPPLAQQVEQIRGANRHVEQTVDRTVEGLIAACGGLLGAEQSSLQTYQKKTSAFDKTLQALDREALLAGIASKLLDMVHELRDENKSVRDEVLAAKDKTIELMARAHAAEQDARVDPLTQLPNRRAFDEAQALCNDSLARNGDPYCVVLFDIDDFKLVNDQYGHAAGDGILAMIGRILRNNRRSNDHVCRLGGEEFALLLPRCDEPAAKLVAERFRQKIESAKLRYRNHELSVTVSCGAAEALLGETRSRLLQKADSALYAAKLQGKNRTCTATDVESEQAPVAEEAGAT